MNSIKISYLVKISAQGDLEQIKYAVEQERVYIREYDDIALRTASTHGHLDIVKYLIEQGANIHIYYDAPLRLAAVEGHIHVVKYLIEQGANAHACNDMAIVWAFDKLYCEETVKYLLSQEPSLYWLTHSNKYVREIYKEYINKL